MDIFAQIFFMNLFRIFSREISFEYYFVHSFVYSFLDFLEALFHRYFHHVVFADFWSNILLRKKIFGRIVERKSVKKYSNEIPLLTLDRKSMTKSLRENPRKLLRKKICEFIFFSKILSPIFFQI